MNGVSKTGHSAIINTIIDTNDQYQYPFVFGILVFMTFCYQLVFTFYRAGYGVVSLFPLLSSLHDL